MTLRVLIQIIPFGDESKARTIETLNISNIGESYLKDNRYEYVLELNSYKTGSKDLPKIFS